MARPALRMRLAGRALAAALALAALFIWAGAGTDGGPDGATRDGATRDGTTRDGTMAVSAARIAPLDRTISGGRASRDALDEARDWLVSVQEPDGSWDPERWGGASEYTIALTGLAMLALTGDERPSARAAVAGATRSLLRSQSSDGHLGKPGRSSLYNHAVGTLALAETARADGELREPVRRAARYLVDRQTAGGAWGYTDNERVTENDSISVWALQALVRAREIDPTLDGAAIDRGFDWFESIVRRPEARTYRGYAGHLCGEADSPLVAFAVLSRGGTADPKSVHLALDRLSRQTGTGTLCFYDSYFLARSSLLERHPALAEFRERTRRALRGSQITTGRLSGSWEPEDRWSPVGGRLYTTALAALALKTERSGPAARGDTASG